MNSRTAVLASLALTAGLRLSLASLLITPLAANAGDLLVFAAASMKPSLDTILASPQAKHIGDIKASYAASSQLARQIAAGAPAMLYISADEDWMNYIAKRKLIAPGTRSDLLANGLVLIAPIGRAHV